MGSEDLFHKRKAKTANDLKRKKESKSTLDRVLIVCEGTKTEPIYFNGLVAHFALHTAKVIDVMPSPSSCPLNLVGFAKDTYLDCVQSDDLYDVVFCVFDKDTHAHYQGALLEIDKLQKNIEFKDVKFYAINSVPCFEYWLILHFTYTTKPYLGSSKSSGQEVFDALLVYFPSYRKAHPKVFDTISGGIDRAIAYAKNSLLSAEKTGTDNPMTKVYQVVEKLKTMIDDNK